MAGGDVRLVGLTKSFGDVDAVARIDLHLEPGEFFSILGPSGCGKTTTLRLIAGFEEPTSGQILLDGVDMAASPPDKRNVNTVFQNYALFPFLNVMDNVSFGLRSQKIEKAEAARRAGEALEMVQLSAYGSRRPNQLSGGQQQRVALARALVMNPAVLLLDEPLGALDAKLRRSLQVQLKTLQQSVGITFLYVTHDQEEALTMSDRLAIMRDGRIAQVGTPAEVYNSPDSAYVADFLGISNLLDATVTVADGGGAMTVEHAGQRLQATGARAVPVGEDVRICIRPERVRLEPSGTTGENHLPATIERLVFLGSTTQVDLRLGSGAALQMLVHNDGTEATLFQGTPVSAVLPGEHVRVLDAALSPVGATA